MQQTATRRKSKGKFRDTLPFWLILPTVLVLLAIQVYPALYTVWLSFHERKPQGWTYVGVDNFQRLFGMGLFGESVGHTVVFLVGYAGLTLVLGFIIAAAAEPQAALFRALHHAALHPVDHCRHHRRHRLSPAGRAGLRAASPAFCRTRRFSRRTDCRF